MLQPVRTKWRKAHKGRIHGTATRASAINYGSFALKALQPERITGKQIEAARVALTRHMKRQGRVWTRVFPNIPVSKKPIEVRMGKGKGNPEFFACRVKPGRILFEVDGVSEQIAKEAYIKHLQNYLLKQKLLRGLLNMKKQEIKKLSKDEMVKNIDKLKKDLFNFRFQKINSQVTNPAKIGETRKTIARLKTILKGKINA